jgi:hypothetical protein
VASDAADNAWLGSSVSISGDTVIAGAYTDDQPGAVDAGALYVFSRVGPTWSERKKIIAPEAHIPGVLPKNFGYAAEIIDDEIYTSEYYGDSSGITGTGKVYYYTFCDADLTYDGYTDGADLGLQLSGWGNSGMGDLNNDGTTDGADLGLLLASWGPCP